MRRRHKGHKSRGKQSKLDQHDRQDHRFGVRYCAERKHRRQEPGPDPAYDTTAGAGTRKSP